MKMRCGKSFVVTIVVLAIVGGYLWHRRDERSRAPVMQVSPEQSGAYEYVHWHQSNAPVATVPASSIIMVQSFARMRSDASELKLATQLSAEESRELTNVFVTKLKPAAEKWFLVYSNRVPFNLADLTMDKFEKWFGNDSKFRFYSFVMGDITFGIQELDGSAYVNYLVIQRGANIVDTAPKPTNNAVLAMPVTREKVVDLIEADSGVRFPTNDVTLTPLSGGAVHAAVGKEVNNPRGGKFTMASKDFVIVFGPDGKLVHYLRTP